MEEISSLSWKDCCSRVFFHEKEILQVGYVYKNYRVCHGCAEFCCGVTTLFVTPHSKYPFSCQCSHIHECLFCSRSDSGALSLTMRAMMLQSMAKHLNTVVFRAILRTISNRVMTTGMNRLRQRLLNQHRIFLLYPSIRAKVHSTVPIELVQSHSLPELLQWFKRDFFSWIKVPPCPHCKTHQHVKPRGSTRPTSEEAAFMASRVELYFCQQCQLSVRFPRYNHPAKLLETRQGRCGEWANCFTCILFNLDFPVRYILDLTDHVWNEVYDENRSEYVHVDCCEPLYDKPLVYEKGWKKKLTCVFAIGQYEVRDVTRRYTRDYENVLCRRVTLCDEIGLCCLIEQLNIQLYRNCTSPEEITRIDQRNLHDYKRIELNNSFKNVKQEETNPKVFGGRISGNE